MAGEPSQAGAGDSNQTGSETPKYTEAQLQEAVARAQAPIQSRLAAAEKVGKDLAAKLKAAEDTANGAAPKPEDEGLRASDVKAFRAREAQAKEREDAIAARELAVYKLELSATYSVPVEKIEGEDKFTALTSASRQHLEAVEAEKKKGAAVPPMADRTQGTPPGAPRNALEAASRMVEAAKRR